MKHLIRQELGGVLTFIGIIWVVYLADVLLPLDLSAWGLVPRTVRGLTGVPLAPFLHGSFAHLLSNTIPLFLLLTLLAGSRTETWRTVAEIVLFGGGLLWLLGRFQNHIGASGLVYGLITFLIVAGIREKRLVPLVIALLVGFLYGGTLISGVLPTVGPGISWDGHLFGALAGAAVAYFHVNGSDAERATRDELPA